MAVCTHHQVIESAFFLVHDATKHYYSTMSFCISEPKRINCNDNTCCGDSGALVVVASVVDGPHTVVVLM